MSALNSAALSAPDSRNVRTVVDAPWVAMCSIHEDEMENYGSLAGDPALYGLSSAVYQPPYCSKPAVSEQEGTPLTVVTYNASHFYWNRKYTMNEAAAYIKHYNPISSASRKLPVTDITIGTASGTLSIMYCINISAGVRTIYRLRSTAVIRSIR